MGLRGDGGAPVFGRHVVGFRGYNRAAPCRAVLEGMNEMAVQVYLGRRIEGLKGL